MVIIVDGIIYETQSQGGISRLYNEILPRMCDMDDLLHITLLTTGQIKQALPTHPRITYRSLPQVERYLRPKFLWRPIIPSVRRLVNRLWVGRGEGQIWHSTYFTLPGTWDGFQFVIVVDMIYERFSNLFCKPWDERFREQKRRCILGADVVVCISETTRQDLQCFYGLDPNSIYVAPLAYGDAFKQLEHGYEKLETLGGRPFLLYVGTRVHYKNFDRLLHAFSEWNHRRQVTLLVVGGSWSANEKWRLADLMIQDSVHLLTCVDDEELCRLYNAAVAFVYPSLYEGFGIPLLEAMACGCPVIASRIPSTIEVAGECPVYFEPTDVDGLLTAFDVVLSEGRNSERVRAGLEHVKSYSWDSMAKQAIEVCHALSNLE